MAKLEYHTHPTYKKRIMQLLRYHEPNWSVQILAGLLALEEMDEAERNQYYEQVWFDDTKPPEMIETD